jgi:hypothetical protein
VLTQTESDEHDTACAAFDEAASKLEELGFVHEITLDGVVFSRSEPDAGEYDPVTKIAAAPFLGLSGAVDLGSLDQVVDAAAYKGLNRCPVLVCPDVKVDGHLLSTLCIAQPVTFVDNLYIVTMQVLDHITLHRSDVSTI